MENKTPCQSRVWIMKRLDCDAPCPQRSIQVWQHYKKQSSGPTKQVGMTSDDEIEMKLNENPYFLIMINKFLDPLI